MNDTSTQLVDPKLTLYAYNLHKSLTSSKTSGAGRLWEWISDIGKRLDIPRLVNFIEQLNLEHIPNEDSGFAIGLLRGDQNLFPFETTGGISGEVCPFLIHDCYAVDFTLRLVGEVPLPSLKSLNPERIMSPEFVKSSLGQTYVFFAGVMDANSINEPLAKQIVASIFSSPENNLLPLSCRGSGKLFKGTIFEYENQQHSPIYHSHILIWLYSDWETRELERIADYYYPLIDLLESRNKIISIYEEDRHCKDEALSCREKLEKKAQIFSQLRQDEDQRLLHLIKETNNKKLIEEVETLKNNKDLEWRDKLKEIFEEEPLKKIFRKEQNERLNMLEKWLLQLPSMAFHYDLLLGDMLTHQSSLRTNIQNYQLALEKLRTISVEGDDLAFFVKFFEKDCQWFQDQIQVNTDIISPGRELFYNLIEAIRGIVDLDAQKQQLANDEAERLRDRNLQIWFTVLGSGLAISAVSTSIAPQLSQVILKDLGKESFTNFPGSWAVFGLINICIHLIVGLMFALVVRFLVRRRFYKPAAPETIELLKLKDATKKKRFKIFSFFRKKSV